MIVKLKRNDKIGLFFFLAFVISSSLLWLFEAQFDAEQWRNKEAIRHEMVDDLIESQVLYNMTKTGVIDLLGEPSSTSTVGKDLFLYRLGTPLSFFKSKPEQLLIVFRNEKVESVTLVVE